MPVLEAWWPRFSGPRLLLPERAADAGTAGAFVDFVKASGRSG